MGISIVGKDAPSGSEPLAHEARIGCIPWPLGVRVMNPIRSWIAWSLVVGQLLLGSGTDLAHRWFGLGHHHHASLDGCESHACCHHEAPVPPTGFESIELGCEARECSEDHHQESGKDSSSGWPSSWTALGHQADECALCRWYGQTASVCVMPTVACLEAVVCIASLLPERAPSTCALRYLVIRGPPAAAA